MTQVEPQQSKRRIVGWILFVFGWIMLIGDNLWYFVPGKEENSIWNLLLIPVKFAAYLALIYVSIEFLILKGLNMAKKPQDNTKTHPNKD